MAVYALKPDLFVQATRRMHTATNMLGVEIVNDRQAVL
jgi:hypothetical protein